MAHVEAVIDFAAEDDRISSEVELSVVPRVRNLRYFFTDQPSHLTPQRGHFKASSERQSRRATQGWCPRGHRWPS